MPFYSKRSSRGIFLLLTVLFLLALLLGLGHRRRGRLRNCLPLRNMDEECANIAGAINGAEFRVEEFGFAE
jgi:hypothetical protein